MKGLSKTLLSSQWLLDKALSGFVLTILPLLAFCPNNAWASTPCDSMLQKKMEQTWKEFREIHPSCFQTIALKHYGGDTCVFVMSEPPGWVSQDSINKLFNSYGGHVGIGIHTWGYDGALKDAIGSVVINSSKFSEFQNALFRLFYGTNYKPYYTNLDQPVPPTCSLPDSLINMPDADSLYSIENMPLFCISKISGSKREEISMSITDLMTKKSIPSGVYYSKLPGYVAWIINPAITTNADSVTAAKVGSIIKANARQFLLDTDLIIDAISSQEGVALVGRERKAPIDVLPPLRSETILLLAQHAKDTLYTDCAAEASISVEDSLYYTPIHMNESLSHSEFGLLKVLAACGLLSNENSHTHDYFSSPTCLDMVRHNQYVYIQEAFKALSRLDGDIQDVNPKTPHVWIEIPTAIVTNAPLMLSNEN